MSRLCTSHQRIRNGTLGRVAFIAAIVCGGSAVYWLSGSTQSPSGNGRASQAIPVPVALVETRDLAVWDSFSGRLEAVDSVAIRSRVAGMIQAVHFREGTLVQQGDLLITIDPAPFAAEVAAAEARVSAAESHLALAEKERERSRHLSELGSGAISQSAVDERENAYNEGEAALRASQAALQSARLNLDYTQIRAPIAGRVGQREISPGNLVAAGPDAPILTRLVSIDPIYASFHADEQTVANTLNSLGARADGNLSLVPVEITTATHDQPIGGRLQMIDNQVDAQTGTVRLRAMFDNGDGKLIPGQFARIRMGKATRQTIVAVAERAVGTDQDRRFVMVAGADNKAIYREVILGSSADGLRIVTAGLAPGDRVVLDGLQKLRPGSLLAPHLVPMGSVSDIDLSDHSESAPASR